jgi:toxin CptA
LSLSLLSTMTIAVSAVVKSSKILQSAVCIYCILILLIASLIGMGKVGDLSFSVRWIISLVLIFLAMLALSTVFLRRKTFHIDISGIGQIRLKEDSGIGGLRRQREEHKNGNSSHLVQLRKDSTIWPYLLLLRLRAEDRRIHTLVILPDCMDRQAFRTLAIACRWIAAQNVHPADTKVRRAKE